MEDLIPTQCNVTNDKPIYIENQSCVPKISSLSSTLSIVFSMTANASMAKSP